MYKKFILFFALVYILLYFMSCQSQNHESRVNSMSTTTINLEKTTNKPLSLDSTVISKEAKDEYGLAYRVVYHNVQNHLDKVSQKKINKAILDSILSMFDVIPEQKSSSIETALAAFEKDYEASVKELGDAAMPWELEINTKVLYNDGCLLAVNIGNYQYTGGAHPNHYSISLNFDVATGNVIQWKDLFYPGFEETILTEASRQIKKSFDLPASAKLSEVLFEDTLVLNNNFNLLEDHIELTYNPYEIAAYAMGTIHISIPYSQVKDYIKFNCILEDLLDKK